MPGEFVQSALAPAGAPASHIAWLWWLTFGICTAVLLAVAGTLAAALAHSHRHGRAGEPRGERRIALVVAGAVGLTVVILSGLLVASVATGRALQSFDPSSAIVVRLTGAQWWWDVVYESPTVSQRVRTANELHLPAGQTAVLHLTSVDVIHSFWAPNFSGKIDLIPGRHTLLWLRPDRPGVYRAQCAEFCGVQHAHMALDVIVDPPEEFQAWLARQRQPAPPPDTAMAARGRQIVEEGSCALCHQVSGTSAGGRTAPDLTHVASRRSLGAGTLPNDRAGRAAWIDDPQRAKPGNRMPPPGLPPPDREAVLAYLETLR